MPPKISIGMAHFQDYARLEFTCQALSMYHDVSDAELIVVDASPHHEDGKDVKDYLAKCAPAWGYGTKYIPLPRNPGTAAPRERIFREASGNVVVVMDCHVLLAPGSLPRMFTWIESHPDDLVSGPLVYEDSTNTSTHFNNVWRAQMWGTWGTDERGRDPKGRPFEVWGQGLGLFACRGEAWLGFNAHFYGFGGEEGYIHEKFRRAGRKVWCLPWLRWWHSFARPGSIKYPCRVWDKVRNYVLGRQELELSLSPVYEHFVSLDHPGESLAAHLERVHGEDPRRLDGASEAELDALHRRHKIYPRQWERLIADPVNCIHPPSVRERPRESSAESLFAACASRFPWMLRLRQLASDCGHVTELCRSLETTAALLAAGPDTMVSIAAGDAPHFRVAHKMVARDRVVETFTGTVHADWLQHSIDATELLVVHASSNSERLLAILRRHGESASRRVAIVDGRDDAIHEWLASRLEWSVLSKDDGLWVLSRDPRDKRPMPSAAAKAANYLQAKALHLLDGQTAVSPEHAGARLSVCVTCPSRVNDGCSECGCPCAKKASWRSSECPHPEGNQWKDVDRRFLSETTGSPSTDG